MLSTYYLQSTLTPSSSVIGTAIFALVCGGLDMVVVGPRGIVCGIYQHGQGSTWVGFDADGWF